MNREQAEHILEAYINLECDGGDNMARQSLREVILDAMTEYRNDSNTTHPGITLGKPLVTYTGTGIVPISWDGTHKVTCSGIDPAFGLNTAAVEGRAER